MSMPTGHPWLHGAPRAWWTGWMYFQDPVLVTSVDVWLTAIGGTLRAPLVPASGLEMRHLPRSRHMRGGATHRTSCLEGGVDVVLDVGRHLGANRRAHRLQPHQSGVRCEGAQKR